MAPSFDLVNGIIMDYMRWVYENDEVENKDFDYLEETFKFNATNNWKTGFDIVKWINGEYEMSTKWFINDLFTARELLEAIVYITDFFDNHYGHHTIKDLKTLEDVVRYYAYVYIEDICYDAEEWVKELDLEIEDDE